MRAIIDTCIIIDFATNRDMKLANDANHILSSSYLKLFDGYITSSSVTDIYYIIHHYLHNKEEALNNLGLLLDYVNIADVTSSDCRNALKNVDKDFEDSVLIECAIRYNADYIITDNLADYVNSPIPAITASDFMQLLLANSQTNI